MAWDAPEHYGVACKRVDARDPATKSVFNDRRAMPAALCERHPRRRRRARRRVVQQRVVGRDRRARGGVPRPGAARSRRSRSTRAVTSARRSASTIPTGKKVGAGVASAQCRVRGLRRATERSSIASWNRSSGSTARCGSSRSRPGPQARARMRRTSSCVVTTCAPASTASLPRPFRHVVVVVVEAQAARERERGLERVQLVERRVAHEVGEARTVRGPARPVDEDHSSRRPIRADSVMMCSTHHAGRGVHQRAPGPSSPTSAPVLPSRASCIETNGSDARSPVGHSQCSTCSVTTMSPSATMHADVVRDARQRFEPEAQPRRDLRRAACDVVGRGRHVGVLAVVGERGADRVEVAVVQIDPELLDELAIGRSHASPLCTLSEQGAARA